MPIEVPEFPASTGSFNVERTAYFDEHARAGRMKGTRGGGAGDGRLIPAPDYLQQQRARMMMMMELAKATAHVDVYIVGSNNTGVGGAAPRARRRAADAAAGAAAAIASSRRRSATSAMANLAGYPAINLPNGFADTGGPTNAVIYAQPFRELEIHRAGEGVSGRRRLPSDQADEAGSDDDDAAALVHRVHVCADIVHTVHLRTCTVG